LTKTESLDKYENEADTYAQENLISKEIWNEIIENRSTLNDDKIIAIGNQYKINPAILLGRVCFEMNAYAMKTKIDKKMK